MDMTVSNSYEATVQKMRERMEAARKAAASGKKNKKKKKVSYDANEIPSQLMRATHSVGVGQILIRANSRLQQLQMCAATGEYDVNALRAAISHAKRMVKCARKKLNNLEEEEQLEAKKRKKNPSASQKKVREAKQKLERELGKLRRRHRGDEKKEIEEAKRCYLQEKVNAERAESAMSEMSVGGIAGMDECAVPEAVEMAPVDASAGASIDVCL